MNTTTTNPKALTTAAEQQAMVDNMPLVMKIAHRCRELTWAKRYGSIDDMVSAGAIGLIYAIRAFQSERGHKFSTVAWTIIVRVMRKASQDEGLVHQINPRAGRQPTPSPRITLDSDRTSREPARSDDFEDRDEEETAYLAGKALSCLNDQELHVVRRRIVDEAPLKRVGCEIGKCGERVRKIQEWSLRKMRRCLEVDAETRTTRRVRLAQAMEGLAHAA